MQFTDIAAVQITTEPMYSIKGTVFYNFNFSRLGKFFEILLDINQPGHKSTIQNKIVKYSGVEK